MSSPKIPIIDFEQVSNNSDAVAEELLEACADWGMLQSQALKDTTC